MWVQKTKAGNYQYVERYRDPATMKLKKVSVTLDGNTRQDVKTAQFALTEKIRELTRHSYQRDYITLQELKSDYIKWKYANLKEQTAATSEWKLNKIVEKIGPGMRIDRLTAPWCRDRLFSEIPSKYNERLKHLKAMMRWAYQNDYIDNISFIDKMPRMKEPPARVKDKYKYLEHDEIAALLKGSPRHWRLLSEFLILSGMRIGEAIALNEADVSGREIVINKTYSLVIEKTTTVKTQTSDRVIYIQDELKSCINKIDRYRKDVCKNNGRMTDIFFPGPDGRRIEYPSYCKFLREKSEALFGRRITPHALRHTHTALMAEAGIPLQDISHRLGHANSRITQEVYMHVTDRMKDEENARLKAVKLL